MRIKLTNALIAMISIIFTLTSCSKNEFVESNTINKINKIEQLKAQAISFSQKHDSLVSEMLSVEKLKIGQKIKSTKNAKAMLDMNEMFEVIEKVTGTRPIALTNAESSKQLAKAKVNVERSVVVDLDVDQLNISYYANTPTSRHYLELVDDVVQNPSISELNRDSKIEEIEQAAMNDPEASLADIETVLNGSETLKGSLSLWQDELSVNSSTSGIITQSSTGNSNLSNWGFFKKLGFVASEDAIGGVLGLFFGGIINVGGVPVYVPPGPSGIVCSSAILSYIAAKMVGW